MKAERRHELQTNSLAQILSDLPLYIRFHANKILVGVIIICLVILLVRYRTSSAQRQREQTRSSLLAARQGVEQLRLVDQPNQPVQQVASGRKQLSNNIAAAVDEVLANTKDPDDAGMRAEALVVRGDLNWDLANALPLPGAATQPALALPQPPEQYLKTAEDAYRQVIKNYDSQKVAKAAALMGLAAIEENRGEWDKAVEYYTALSKDQEIASSFRELATQRLSMIPQLKEPVVLATFSATQPGTQPAIPPGIAAPTTAPGTQLSPGAISRITPSMPAQPPASAPAPPSSQPATAP